MLVAIRFRWIWVGRAIHQNDKANYLCCRNPLSLDMGWKRVPNQYGWNQACQSQSAFAGYGLEEKYIIAFVLGIIPVAIRFRWIWVGRDNANDHFIKYKNGRNPLSLDMGWKSQIVANQGNWPQGRNPLSLDMGWKSAYGRTILGGALSRNPLSLDMGWKSVQDNLQQRL